MQFFTKNAISCDSCKIEQHLIKCQYCKACFCLNCIYQQSKENCTCLRCHAKYNKLIRYFVYKDNSKQHILQQVFEMRNHIQAMLPNAKHTEEVDILAAFINESFKNNYILSLYIDLLKGNYNIGKYYKNLVKNTFNYDPSNNTHYSMTYYTGTYYQPPSLIQSTVPKVIRLKKFKNRVRSIMNSEFRDKTYRTDKNKINISNNLIFILRNPRTYKNSDNEHSLRKTTAKRSTTAYGNYELFVEKPISRRDLFNMDTDIISLFKEIESINYTDFKQNYYIPINSVKYVNVNHHTFIKTYVENPNYNKTFNNINSEIHDINNYIILKEHILEDEYYKITINKDISGYFVYRNHYKFTYGFPYSDYIPKHVFQYDLETSTAFFSKLCDYINSSTLRFYFNTEHVNKLLQFCNLCQESKDNSKICNMLEQSIVIMINQSYFDYENINLLLSYVITRSQNKIFLKNIMTYIRILLFKCNSEKDLDYNLICLIDDYLLKTFNNDISKNGLYNFTLLNTEVNNEYYQKYCESIKDDNNFNKIVNSKMHLCYHKLFYNNPLEFYNLYDKELYKNTVIDKETIIKKCPVCKGDIVIVRFKETREHRIYCKKCLSQYNLKLNRLELERYASTEGRHYTDAYNHYHNNNVYSLKRTANTNTDNNLCISPWFGDLTHNSYKFYENKIYNRITCIHKEITKIKNELFKNILLFMNNNDYAIALLHKLNIQKCLLKIIIEFWRSIMFDYKDNVIFISGRELRNNEITEYHEITDDITNRYNKLLHNYNFIDNIVKRFVENSYNPKAYKYDSTIFNNICKYIFKCYCGIDDIPDNDFQKMCKFMKNNYDEDIQDFNHSWGQIQIDFIKNTTNNSIDYDNYFDIIKNIILSNKALNINDIINYAK